MIRRSFLAMMLASASVSGCSFTPVYQNYSGLAAQTFNYASPGTRLEQVIYQRLQLSFPQSGPSAAPDLTVTVAVQARDLGKTRRRPYDETEITVTATATIVQDDQVLNSIARQATAIYADASQVLANSVARQDAEEQAALSAAESLRLALLAEGSLTRHRPSLTAGAHPGRAAPKTAARHFRLEE